MKKLLSLILTGIIAVGMVGCSVEENAEDSSEEQVKQEQKQEVKQEQANQDTENSKKETTKKDNNSNNTSKENNTKKQTDKNIENTKEEAKQTTKESKKYEVGSDEWKDECVKDGTHLQEEADKQDSNPETNLDEPELPQDDWQPEDDERYMCSYCREWFTADELARHEAVCKHNYVDKYEVNDNSYSYDEEVDDEMVDEDTYNEYN